MKILITGATGLIGRALCRVLLSEGHRLVVLSRNPAGATRLAAAGVFAWQPEQAEPPVEAFDGVEAVIHLAGENVAARWTAERKRRIRDSRVSGTRNLVAGMRRATKPPRILLSASAVGFYGDRGAEVLTEASPRGTGFLSEVCEEWEAAARQAQTLGARVVTLRTGVALSREGGALKTMLPAFQFGVGGKLGNGRHWFPWIHLADIVGLFRHALLNEALSGPVNGTAPNPVTNEEFTKELAAVLHRPALFPVPKLALELLFGEMAGVMLASLRVLPEAALNAGYQFQFPALRPALEDLFSER
jgi:uncharacterized protein (TIGR01777 family)